MVAGSGGDKDRRKSLAAHNPQHSRGMQTSHSRCSVILVLLGSKFLIIFLVRCCLDSGTNPQFLRHGIKIHQV